jgi:Family of unknown function (DUF6544)
MQGNLRQRLAADVAALGLPGGPDRPVPVTPARLAALPPAAQRYLRFMGVADGPPEWSFLAHLTGRFRLRPGMPWLRCEAWQYSTCPTVTRLFHMRLSAAGLIRMTGRDAYARGEGRMHGTLAGLVTVADSAGPETSQSELVTYLNDAVLLAPSMLLALPVRWAPADDSSFEITLEDGGYRVTARVFLDERGAPADFSTEDRWCALPGGPVRTRWSTPVDGWRQVDGRWLPSAGSAVWHLPGGPFRYAEFRFGPGSLRYNVAPADVRPPEPGGLPGAVHRMANWGSTYRERSTALPGDELVPGPASVTTLATTVEAGPEKVWPWLVQIGQDRGGLYSYDWLENLFGLGIHSARQIREEWQHLTPGDEVRLVRKGWLGLKDGLALPVARVDPGRAIVLREQPPAQPWDAIWSFHVVPQGPGRCRLISRGRSARPHGAARVATWVMTPVTTLMTRKMLLGIKRRAESGGVRPPAGRAGRSR